MSRWNISGKGYGVSGLALALGASVGLLIAPGCGEDETTQEESFSETIITTDDATEEQCEHGGVAITFGVDTSGDGEIDQGGETTVVCDGAPGRDGDDGDEGPRGDEGQDGEDGSQGPPGDDGEDGEDGEDGQDGQDGVCAGADPLEVDVSLEEANYHRVDHSYELVVDAGAEGVEVELLGDLTVESITESGQTHEASIRFWEAKSTGVLVVATDGCQLDVVRLDAEVYPPPYIQLAATVFHTCGLRADGTITCWGMEQHPADLVEIDDDVDVDLIPLGRAPQGDDFVDLKGGLFSACGHRANGRVSCRSAHLDGEPALADPTGVYYGVTPGSEICVLDTPQSGYCERINDPTLAFDAEGIFGSPAPELAKVGYYLFHIGDGPTTYKVVRADGQVYTAYLEEEDPETERVFEAETFVETALDFAAFCGINSDELFMCEFAAVDPEEESEMSPDFQSPTVGAQSVDTAMTYGCATFDDGSVECLGEVFEEDLFGEWVDPEELSETVFDVPEGIEFVDVATGLLHACGLTADQGVICWGDVTVDGESYPEVTTPVQ